MPKSAPANPINARFLSILFIVVFIIVGIPVGIVISRSQQIIKEKAGTEEGIVGPTIYEEENPDEFGCKTSCVDECKRIDNCLGSGNQFSHCGWTKTKPVVEKKWCRQCSYLCPTLTSTFPLEVE